MARRLMDWWEGSSRRARAGIVGGVAVIFVLAGAGAVATGGGQPTRSAAATPPVLVTTVQPSRTPTRVARTTSTQTPTPTPITVKTLDELADRFGDAPQATRGRFRIPSIGVDAPLSQRNVGPELNLRYLNPYGPADVTWYDFSAAPQYGGTPGSGRNAIFAGHVDYADPIQYAPNVEYFGPGIFRNIDLVAPGDAIEVSMGDQTVTFSVVWKRQVSEHDDWAAIYEGDVPEGDAITIITCSGTYDPVTREYDSRTVIRAARS